MPVSKADQRAERVALLALTFRRIARADAGDYRCYSTALECVKLADRMERAAVRYCNGQMDDAVYDAGRHKIKEKLFEIVESSDGLGVVGIIKWVVGGDPRGYVLKFKHPEVSGNTWGGSMLGNAYGV